MKHPEETFGTRRDGGGPQTDCNLCGGTGAVFKSREPGSPPTMVRCRCRLEMDLIANAERGWPGLSSARPINTSPLFKALYRDMRITCTRGWLMTHLRHVVLRQSPNWQFLVVTDAQLMTAWLANLAVQGAEIFDADAMVMTTSHYSLEDLCVPPSLLVLYLGVKAARNSAMPEVVLETLTLRQHAGMPTWLVDQPIYPLVRDT